MGTKRNRYFVESNGAGGWVVTLDGVVAAGPYQHRKTANRQCRKLNAK